MPESAHHWRTPLRGLAWLPPKEAMRTELAAMREDPSPQTSRGQPGLPGPDRDSVVDVVCLFAGDDVVGVRGAASRASSSAKPDARYNISKTTFRAVLHYILDTHAQALSNHYIDVL